MTESSWPFDNADTSEAQYSQLARFIADTGVFGTPQGNQLKLFADSTGMFVKIPAGLAMIRGFLYLNDSQLTKSIGAAGSAPRVDGVVLRLDPAVNSVLIIVKQGSAGSTQPPALEQTDNGVYEFLLGSVSVPANTATITNNLLTDLRIFSSHTWGSWSTGTRPGGAREGKAGYNYTTKQPEYWNGSTWVPFQSAVTNVGTVSGTLPSAALDYGVMQAFRGDRNVDAPVVSDIINGDWNTIFQPGAYRVQAGYINTNMPPNSYPYGTLLIIGAGQQISSRTQVYYEHGSNGLTWTRTAWNGNDWNQWRASTERTYADALSARIDQEISDRSSTMAQLRTDATNGDQGIRNDLNNVQNNANARVYNQQNATRMAAGNVLVTNFAKDATTNTYVGYADVGWPAMGIISATATAQSADSGGVTAMVTNIANGGCRVVVVRRNAVNTGVSWIAVGN